MCETVPQEGHTPTLGGMTLAPAMKCLVSDCSSFYISTTNYKASYVRMNNKMGKIRKEMVMT
jgi:predicted enzyme related to lactoylglutathione lyase